MRVSDTGCHVVCTFYFAKGYKSEVFFLCACVCCFALFSFPQGWRSVYVNEPGEVLAWCTHQPTNLTWRIKQVLRWHQGAVQLLYTKVRRNTHSTPEYTCVLRPFPSAPRVVFWLRTGRRNRADVFCCVRT